MHDAVSGGHLATARVLLDHAADPNLRASGGGAEAELPLGLALSLPSVLAAREMARHPPHNKPEPEPRPSAQLRLLRVGWG